jgi:hypothetical protein
MATEPENWPVIVGICIVAALIFTFTYLPALLR